MLLASLKGVEGMAPVLLPVYNGVIRVFKDSESGANTRRP